MRQKSTKLSALALGLALAAGAAAASCSGESKTSDQGTGGTSAMPMSIECGANTCQPVIIAKGIAPLLPCCVGEDGCGLDSSFLTQYGVMFSETCQAKNQPGELGHGCPDSPALAVPNSTFMVPPLPGCCRTDTNTCGYQLDKILGLFDVGLGCVDSSPFLDGGTPSACDPEGTAGAGP